MIGIIDYGMGNLKSVYNALYYLGEDPLIIDKPKLLKDVNHIILPGVGAFGDAIRVLRSKGFVDELNEMVIHQKKQFLGICLGMQLIVDRSFEFGIHEGFGWIPGEVIPFKEGIPTPHMGWNDIVRNGESQILAEIPMQNADFYFLHSFYLNLVPPQFRRATVHYSCKFPVVIEKDNIHAVQFHPEKSQDNGLKILENFISIG